MASATSKPRAAKVNGTERTGWPNWEGEPKELAPALARDWNTTSTPSEINGRESRRPPRPSQGRQFYELLEREGRWSGPVTKRRPLGTPVMQHGRFCGADKGKIHLRTENMSPPTRRPRRSLPAAASHTGRILSQYNVGAQTRRSRERRMAITRTGVEFHPHEAEGSGGVARGDWVKIQRGRAGKSRHCAR